MILRSSPSRSGAQVRAKRAPECGKVGARFCLSVTASDWSRYGLGRSPLSVCRQVPSPPREGQGKGIRTSDTQPFAFVSDRLPPSAGCTIGQLPVPLPDPASCLPLLLEFVSSAPYTWMRHWPIRWDEEPAVIRSQWGGAECRLSIEFCSQWQPSGRSWRALELPEPRPGGYVVVHTWTTAAIRTSGRWSCRRPQSTIRLRIRPGFVRFLPVWVGQPQGWASPQPRK